MNNHRLTVTVSLHGDGFDSGKERSLFHPPLSQRNLSRLVIQRNL